MSAMFSLRVVATRTVLSRSSRHFSTPATSHEASLIAQSEDVPKYPPVKPKYPPGTWGKMEPKYAWQWQDLKEKLVTVGAVRERQAELLKRETIAMFKIPRREHRVHNFDERVSELIDYAAATYILEPFCDHPQALDFRKAVTKTHLLPWQQEKPKIFDSFDVRLVEDVVRKLKSHISDHILLEKSVERPDELPEKKKSRFSKSLIRCISEALISELGGHMSHARTCAYDEDVIVRALWNRHGIERKKQIWIYDPDVKKYDTVQDHPVIAESVFDAMIRYHLPLPEFVPDLSRGLTNVELPQVKYKPSVYGQGKAGHTLLKSILAGHKPGDPCEYGLVGFLSTYRTQDIEKPVHPKVARDCRLATGVTATFAWLAAQACNQGFNQVIDLTYPLTSQMIMTDGEVFSFLAYQLNTLELWKDNDGNSKVNLCWHTDEMPLYHSVEDGKVRELNDETLAILVKMFMLEPVDRGYDMKPTISEKPDSLHLKQDFIPEKPVVEKVIQEEQFIVT